MKKDLLLLSFVEGGAVMCAELCGARLLAPVFGTSLYVWAAVMGVTLGALASGYFFGGRFSNPSSQQKALRNILLAASVYLLLMPAIAKTFLPILSSFPFITGMIAGTIVLLLPPVFFLGAASPLFIGIQSTAEQAARVSGTVYAVSTAGGIVSTFLCGFLLIPELGLTISLVIHGGILLVFSMGILRGKFLVPVLSAVVSLTLLWSSQLRTESVYSEDGVQGRLEVRDIEEGGVLLRRLLLNGIIQTETDRLNGRSTMKYLGLTDTLLSSREPGRALVLGAGGGSLPNLLAERGYEVTAIEFDERILDAAEKYFGLSPHIRLVHDDARRFINTATERFDVIVADVFKAEEQPAHVLTVESLQKIRQLLVHDGLLLVNWHGYEEGYLASGTQVLKNTLAVAGYSVRLFYTGNDPHYRNILLCAEPNGIVADKPGPVNTDDRPALEKYNAQANAAWRRNYLRYYSVSR